MQHTCTIHTMPYISLIWSLANAHTKEYSKQIETQVGVDIQQMPTLCYSSHEYLANTHLPKACRYLLNTHACRQLSTMMCHYVKKTLFNQHLDNQQVFSKCPHQRVSKADRNKSWYLANAYTLLLFARVFSKYPPAQSKQVLYTTYYKPMGNPPHISSEQGAGVGL